MLHKYFIMRGKSEREARTVLVRREAKAGELDGLVVCNRVVMVVASGIASDDTEIGWDLAKFFTLVKASVQPLTSARATPNLSGALWHVRQSADATHQ